MCESFVSYKKGADVNKHKLDDLCKQKGQSPSVLHTTGEKPVRMCQYVGAHSQKNSPTRFLRFMSLLPSWNNSATTGRIFMKFDI